jgi:hypothetical protein
MQDIMDNCDSKAEKSLCLLIKANNVALEMKRKQTTNQ